MKQKMLLFSLILFTYSTLSAQWTFGTGNDVILIDGNRYVGIGPDFNINAATQTVDVNGNVRIRGLSLMTQQDNTLDRILVSDNNGNLYWRDASSIGQNDFPSFPASAGDSGSNTNSFFGHLAGSNAGLNNTFVGNRSGIGNSGSNNTFVGRNSGSNNTSGSGNVFLGANTGGMDANTSDRLYIDNSDTPTPLIWGDFQNDLLTINGEVGIGTSTPQESLHVIGNAQIDGNVEISNTITASQVEGSVNWNNLTNVPDALVPAGAIIMWSGNIGDIPSGWAFL